MPKTIEWPRPVNFNSDELWYRHIWLQQQFWPSSYRKIDEQRESLDRLDRLISMRFIPIIPFYHEQIPEDPTSFLLRYQTLFDEGYLLDFDRRAFDACCKNLGDLLDPVGAELIRLDILWICERIDKNGLLH